MRSTFQWLRQVSMILLATVAFAAPVSAQLVAGKDYLILKPAQPVTTGKNIELIEFFWYGCPHCAHLQPPLHEWLKRKPADVTLRRQPAAFQDNWVQLARTYYAIETIDAVDKLHLGLFDAIHKTKTLNPNTLMKDQKPLFDWVASKGVDRKKFEDAYKSFGVASKSQRTIDTTSAYDISGTPAVVIDGKFIISPGMTLKPDNSVNYELFFRRVEQLIEMARRSRGGK